MAAALEELINNLYEQIQDSVSIPFASDKGIVNKDTILDILDELRENLPSDIRMANEIVAKRNEYIDSGRKEVESLRNDVEAKARVMLSEHEITKEANKKAREIVGGAEIKARELIKSANSYCDDSLKRTEESVNQLLREVKEARRKLRDFAGR